MKSIFKSISGTVYSRIDQVNFVEEKQESRCIGVLFCKLTVLQTVS